MGESKEEKASRLSPYRKQYFHWRFIEGYEHTEITGKFEKLLKLLGETNIPSMHDWKVSAMVWAALWPDCVYIKGGNPSASYPEENDHCEVWVQNGWLVDKALVAVHRQNCLSMSFSCTPMSEMTPFDTTRGPQVGLKVVAGPFCASFVPQLSSEDLKTISDQFGGVFSPINFNEPV